MFRRKSGTQLKQVLRRVLYCGLLDHRKSTGSRLAVGPAFVVITLVFVHTNHLSAQSGLELPPVPPAPALENVHQATAASKAVTKPLPQNARAAELWQDKPLNQLKASITGTDPDEGALSASETERLTQAQIIMSANGTHVSPLGDSRPWMLMSFEWEAPATRHLPLMFEEPNLERLGYTYTFRTPGGGSICAGDCVQPFVSGAHFFGRLPLLPYMCGINPPCEPVYTLGVDRPGSPVPYRRHNLPLSLRGAIYEAGAVVGMFYCIP